MLERAKSGLCRGALAALTVLVVGAPMAVAQVTLPDVGVEVADTATAMGTALGTIVQTLVTIFGAFMVVWLGLKWVRRTIK